MRLTGMIELAADASRETVIATLSQGINEALARLDDERLNGEEQTALGQVRVAFESVGAGVSLTVEAERVVPSLPMVTGEEFKASRSFRRAMRRALR